MGYILLLGGVSVFHIPIVLEDISNILFLKREVLLVSFNLPVGLVPYFMQTWKTPPQFCVDFSINALRLLFRNTTD